MNPSAQNPFVSNSGSGALPGSGEFEATLRLIASLPAPEGLEKRVEAGLLTAPRRARILQWPTALRLENAWVRTAAAAAIVCVVVGGGWGISSRVQPAPQVKAITVPPHGSAPGGFSSAGAMRTPQTLNGPVVAHPAKTPRAQTKAAASARAKTPARHGKPVPAKNPSAPTPR
jgi:hypothetical protein